MGVPPLPTCSQSRQSDLRDPDDLRDLLGPAGAGSPRPASTCAARDPTANDPLRFAFTVVRRRRRHVMSPARTPDAAAAADR